MKKEFFSPRLEHAPLPAISQLPAKCSYQDPAVVTVLACLSSFQSKKHKAVCPVTSIF